MLTLVLVAPAVAEMPERVRPPADTQPAAERLYKGFVADLAAEPMEGRAVGTRGGELARDYIAEQFRQAGLTPAFGDSFLQPFEAKIPFRKSATTAPAGVLGVLTSRPATEIRKVTVHNVVGLVPGRGKLADEAIVIGGHYDHVGLTGKKDANGKAGYFPGADDNASGASGVMLLARWFVAKQEKLPAGDRRTVIFASFTGEERGLWGSAYLAGHLPVVRSATQPDRTVPLRVVAMLNLDMIGRLRNNRIYVQGVESGEQWPAVIEAAAKTVSLDVRTGGGGMGPSDHTSFYLKKIPVLFFITGGHGDVHQPSDTADKINVAGAVQVLRLVEAVADALRGGETRVAYLPPKPTVAAAGGGKGGAILGIVPDPSGVDDDGCVVVDVLANGPAEKAGLKPDDIIVKWNDTPIRGARGVLTAVAAAKPGDAVKLQVRREGQVLDVPVTLGQR